MGNFTTPSMAAGGGEPTYASAASYRPSHSNQGARQRAPNFARGAPMPYTTATPNTYNFNTCLRALRFALSRCPFLLPPPLSPVAGQPPSPWSPRLFSVVSKNCVHFSICACHPCAGAMLIFSESFQFYRMILERNPYFSEWP